MNAWPKTTWTEAGQIFDFVGSAIRHGGAPDELRQPPHAYFGKLVEAGSFHEALYFVGHALPRYESVVWATQTLLASGAVDRTNPLVVAVLRWIDDPCEDLRRRIEQIADDVRVITPAYLLARAAFMSGGSISKPDTPPVLAPADACAKFAVGAVLEAASLSDSAEQFMRQAAELGEGMASQAG
jgi:hypothetical protein